MCCVGNCFICMELTDAAGGVAPPDTVLGLSEVRSRAGDSAF